MARTAERVKPRPSHRASPLRAPLQVVQVSYSTSGGRRVGKSVWIGAAAAWFVAMACGAEEEKAAEDAAVTCCQCLVNEGCVRASEYELCRDTLERGGALRLSGLRDLACNEDACVEANQCASRSGTGASSSGDDSSDDDSSGDDSSGDDSSGDGPGDDPVGGNAYVLVVDSAEYAATDLDGAAWDLFGGDEPPDAFVSVRIDGESIGVTDTAYDTYSPTWDDEFVFTATRSTTLSFRFFDLDDASGDDFGGEFIVEDLALAIDEGGASVALEGIAVQRLTFSIRPR